VLSGNRVVSLANGDADMAIRPVRPTDEQLFGRKMTDIRWAIDGATEIQNRSTGSPDLEAIGFGGGSLAEKTMELQMERIKASNSRLFSDSLILTASLAANSGAQCFIPLVLGEQWPSLTRKSDPFEHEFGVLWIVCHKDLRRNARVRVVFEYLIEAAKKDPELFQGPMTDRN